jgi:glycosyltransferase involved in cell wall biosynthesis
MSTDADISVVIPAHNEADRLADTLASIASTRTTSARVEVVIADDVSDDDLEGHLKAAWPRLSQHAGLHVRVHRLTERHGVPRGRNAAARLASADVLFMTDAHVRFTRGWDATVLDHIAPDRVLAGAIAQANSDFVGYGCRLVVPFMGTYWNKRKVEHPTQVQIAACPATALTRDLFERLGGYDEGMVRYGAAEPEFSVRAWLGGAEILLLPDLRVEHRFKPQQERVAFVKGVREHMVANALRFGLLYSSEEGAMQLLRYHSIKFPNLFAAALAAVERSDVWERRAYLEQTLARPFSWYVEHFDLKDQKDGALL